VLNIDMSLSVLALRWHTV